ncbi:glycosyltransferase domain-containing protein [Microbacterium sp. NPDC089189]|uniref:glycosyltransferase domain-containing protein n=1 Tax=Microbacterium sp. NPDC089189 TaxID=3154972 RepID=UPI00342D595F
MSVCVYTVLLGGYDALLAQPVRAESDADFICFTDDPDLTSDTWRIELVDPRFPQDIHRSSRVVKILGDPRLEQYEATLCIDATVRLKSRPEDILAEWLGDGTDMALAQHSFRETVLDEFDEVVRLNYDDRARVHEQLIDYSIAYPEVLDARPHWGGMIARRRTPAVAGAMRLWFDHVLRYSRRDQLSLMVALLHGGATYRSIELDNYVSTHHEWPVLVSRKIALGKAAALPTGPMVAELRRAHARIAELEATLAERDPATIEEMRAHHAQLETRIEEGDADREQLADIIEQMRGEVRERDRRLADLDTRRGAFANAREVLFRKER